MLGRATAALALTGVRSFGPGARSSETCGIQTLCGVAGGEYRVSVPTRWDGRSPMPLALFFHGYLGSAADQMADEGLRRVFSDAGILLVFPDGGSARDWVHIGAAAPRDDVAFTRAVLVDVRRRWPIAEPFVWVAGFSSGAFMVWKLACESGMSSAMSLSLEPSSNQSRAPALLGLSTCFTSMVLSTTWSRSKDASSAGLSRATAGRRGHSRNRTYSRALWHTRSRRVPPRR